MVYASLKYKRNAIEKGYTSRILKIDLTEKKITVIDVPEEMQKQFVGGRGYCLKLVYDGTNADTKFNSPENILAFAGGPFCGETGFAGSGKFIVGTISPLTNTFCDSNVGGHFFPLVKLSGFDAISVAGKSEEEIIVIIDGNKCEVSLKKAPKTRNTLLDADELVEQWNGDGKLSNIAFVCAGTGAKNTYLGCINSVYYDVRRKRCRSKQAGRGGTGSVMREKGLWGIVAKCDESKSNANKPADRERVRAAGKSLRKVINEVDPKAMSLCTQGTTALIDMMNSFHLLPVNNYQYGSDERAHKVSGSVFEKNYFKQDHPDGCFAGCHLACTKGYDEHKLLTGPFAGRTVAVDGPEYESAANITNLGIFDIEHIFEYNFYCDEYGIDTISTGVVLSFLFEAYERGLITKEDTDGLELTWGNAETAVELLHRMAAGKGDFPLSAGKGVRYMKNWIAGKASARNGRSYDNIMEELSLFAMEAKGLEFSMYITKESLAQQGGYGFALKGPQHDEAWLIAIDQLNKELPTFKKKAMALKWFPLIRTWFNVVGLCKLPWIDVRHPEAKHTDDPSKNLPTIDYYLELVNATLGTEKSLDDLLAESERCYLLHKLINLRQGFGTREHDMIPLRAMAPVFMNEYESRKSYYEKYLTDTAGIDISSKTDDERLEMLQAFRQKEYEKLADEVYNEKGYDWHGIPHDETLKRLRLDQAENLEIVSAARKRIK